MAAEAEAKQLDSVTDVVKEAELDASKAQEAMSALSTAKQEDDGTAAALAAVAVRLLELCIGYTLSSYQNEFDM